MIECIINILIISTCITLIWDWFNAPQNIVNQLVSWYTNNKITNVELKKPFGCSTCITFWLSIIYLFIALPLSFKNILYCTLFALCAALSVKWINYIIQVVDALISKILIILEQLISKLHIIKK